MPVTTGSNAEATPAPDAAARSAGSGKGLRRATVRLLPATAPWLFVVLWSTGFLGAKYGLPFAPPFTFLFIRMQIAWILLVGISAVRRAPWPRDRRQIGHVAVTGVLLHAGYLGGVFYAISRGMPAGLSSLIVGLQPILTAVCAQALLRERVVGRQWLGLVLGLAGVGLVVEEKVRAGVAHSIPPGAFVAIAVALIATTAGTLYQKRFGAAVDITSAAAIQYFSAGIVLGVLAFTTEEMHVRWTGKFVFALGWLVLVLSLGAVSLLLVLIRGNSVSRVASLLYLVPPATAIEAYLLFDERFGPTALAGLAVVAVGVALVMRQPARRGL